MRIALSAAGSKKEDLLDRRFGRCEYFQIYDTVTKEFRSISNQGALSGGGAGIAAANQILEEQADVIITGSLGPNAYEIINKAEIGTFCYEAIPVYQAIERFLRNELMNISTAGIAHHGVS